MRKYTQLGLVLLTIISITVLLVYRNEYRQLKYVLDVVNFIGRKDELDLARIENRTNYVHSTYDFSTPLPIWQRIGNDFHAYSAFWMKTSLKSGGEIVTIVVGLKHSIVSFKCDVKYADSKYQKGKFVFIREEVSGGPSGDEGFIVYKFVCKVAKDYGVPEKVIFTDGSSKSKHYIRVRNLETKHIKELHLMTVCADLISDNDNIDDPIFSEFNVLQFFFHNYFIGVDEFLVYDNGLLNASIQRILARHGIQVNVFPYNFPFEADNSHKKRRILELDCLLRTSNSVKYTVLSTPRDYLYPNGHLQSAASFLRNLKNPAYGNEGRFEIKSNDVCIHHAKKIFSDNLFSSTTTNSSADYKIILYKPSHVLSGDSSTLPKMHLSSNDVFNNRYINCDKDIDADKHGNGNLQRWRAAIPSDFLLFVDQIGVEINAALRNSVGNYE